MRADSNEETKPAGRLLHRLARGFTRQHTRQSDQQAIRFHYDVSNDFYALWLDAERVYSCAYFKSAPDTLDQAQQNKLEHICRKLRLQPGERLLDIGCGWGALVCWVARFTTRWPALACSNFGACTCLYMAACALEFEAGGTGIYQVLASQRGVETALPLMRQDLYENSLTPSWHAPLGRRQRDGGHRRGRTTGCQHRAGTERGPGR
jgi:hypothetical protein